MVRQIGLWVSLISFALSPLAHAETKLSYPELEVTPRASERLALEAGRENEQRFFSHWPVQMSALATIVVSNQASPDTQESADVKDDYEDRKSRALMIGAGWFIATAALSAAYRPYYSGNKEVAKLPATNMREQLVKERLAEEALYRPASMTTMMSWLSVLSNGYANVSLMKDGSSGAKAAASIGTLAALLPFIFEHRWDTVATMHREYKKKIYGPVGGPILMPTGDGRYAYGTGLSWKF